MRIKQSVRVGVLLLLGSSCSTGAQNGQAALGLTKVAGTGVTMVLPPGLRPGPVGSYFIDTSGETILTIMVGFSSVDIGNDPVNKALFPDPPELLHTPSIVGNLYRRVRATSGGQYDSFMLVVKRPMKELAVKVTYTGSDAAKFERLRALFSNLSWNENHLDAERAFGAKLTVRGLRVVLDRIGGLSYVAIGQPDQASPALAVVPLSVTSSQAKHSMPAGCATGFAAAFRGQDYSGPNLLNEKGIAACDAWGRDPDGRMRYMMFMLVPNGGLLEVMGWGDPTSLRAALLTMRVTRSTRANPED